jgi:hypothetical protein
LAQDRERRPICRNTTNRLPALQGNEQSPFLSLVGKEISERDAKRLGDEAQVQDGDVPLAALDGADEGAVQAAQFSQLSLGEPSGGTQLPDLETHLVQKFSVVKIHT